MFVALYSAFVLAQAAPAITVASRAVQPGEVLLVTVTADASDAPVTVRAFNKAWPVYAVDPGLRQGSGQGQWRALVGIDLDTRPGRYTLDVTIKTAQLARTLNVLRHTFPTRRLTVDPNLVNPPPDARERIARETRELSEIWRASSADRLWRAFERPVPDDANSAFGTRSVYNGEMRTPHTGADFLSPSGRPVKAPAAGRVVLAGPLYFTGNTVVIDHGEGLFSLLAHLSEIDVAAGVTIAAGDVVGHVGATGRVTGPHLHWTVRLNGARVDPLSLLYVAGSAPDAQHEREEGRDSGNLADPEDERPAQRFNASRGQFVSDGREPLLQRRMKLLTQKTDFVRQPALESIRRRHQHLFTPVLAFGFQEFNQSEGGVVAEPRSDDRGDSIAPHV